MSVAENSDYGVEVFVILFGVVRQMDVEQLEPNFNDNERQTDIFLARRFDFVLPCFSN